MIKILFVCHGNICRSPMAEFIMKDMVKKAGLADQFMIASAATSTEEIGNPVHRGTKAVLNNLGIDCSGKRSVQLKKSDYSQYDYFIGMDGRNLHNMQRIFGSDPEHKINLLLTFAGRQGEIADPWYTGRFEDTYCDVKAGCEGLLAHITEHNPKG